MFIWCPSPTFGPSISSALPRSSARRTITDNVPYTFATRRLSDALTVSGNGPVSRTPELLSGLARGHALLHPRSTSGIAAGALLRRDQRASVGRGVGAVCRARLDRDPWRHRGRPARRRRRGPGDTDAAAGVRGDRRRADGDGSGNPHAFGGRRRAPGDGSRGSQPNQQGARRKRPGAVPGKATRSAWQPGPPRGNRFAPRRRAHDADVAGEAPSEGRSVRLPRFHPSLRLARLVLHLSMETGRPLPRDRHSAAAGRRGGAVGPCGRVRAATTPGPIGAVCGTTRPGSFRRSRRSE